MVERNNKTLKLKLRTNTLHGNTTTG